jgi:hypothetical protein
MPSSPAIEGEIVSQLGYLVYSNNDFFGGANMPDKKHAARHPWFPDKVVVLSLVFSAALIGCDGGAQQAAVSGKVTYMGEAVKGGTLIFGPIGEGNVGQPASANIQPDGTYVLGTNRASDGALIARHRVAFTPPPQELTKEQQTDPTYIAPPPAYMGMVPRQVEVAVKAGKNTIDIELVPAPQQ